MPGRRVEIDELNRARETAELLGTDEPEERSQADRFQPGSRPFVLRSERDSKDLDPVETADRQPRSGGGRRHGDEGAVAGAIEEDASLLHVDKPPLEPGIPVVEGMVEFERAD
jgi:hypothetical protein